ncbi:nucleotidyltransferase family protein [Altererythrobacter arenosus]|uniref:Nucleotidyltransferase family protein n=1 Tax=Altererythrobacter arenosus TaxID=3032592 RepID=A0ABY8FWJ9_9SPHN|nr:nucleotidyltransferase family protein [Altererythrobacter sp. CAU 1644]WFL77776.1 nucleotidyltransferase family protein [Altererythrobacter sp. CAU 1644]
MTGVGHVGLVLLAAGRSRRFGPQDKLAQDWRGKPLARHAADTLAALPFAAHIAVVGEDSRLQLPEQFETVTNPDPALGLSHSIALGVEALLPRHLDACLIALADMPLVPEAHFLALLDGVARSDGDIVATANGDRAQVPAVFGKEHFAALIALTGDQGARELLRTARTIPCDAELLADFDRPEDFARNAD